MNIKIAQNNSLNVYLAEVSQVINFIMSEIWSVAQELK